MKQTANLLRSTLDLPEKEKEVSKKKPNSRDSQSECPVEDPEKPSGTTNKPISHFDFNSLSFFFNHKPSNSRSSNDSYASRVHSQKKANETSSSKESTLKRISSKDFSNLEELNENTTIITNPLDTKATSNKQFNEISGSKQLSDGNGDGSQEESHESPYVEKDKKTKKNRGTSFSGVIRPSKDEKLDQQIMGTISKLGLNGEGDEQDKADTSVSRDLKITKTNYNIEVIERIKSKALHHRKTSFANNVTNYNTNPNVTNPNSSSIMNTSGISTQNQSEMRTNNNSLFNGFRKINKVPIFPMTTSQMKKDSLDANPSDPFKDLSYLIFPALASEIPEPVVGITAKTQPNETGVKLNEKQEVVNEAEKVPKKKRNLSTIVTDCTIDGDSLTFNFNYHNNSFSTLLSGGNSNSFNNSGKTDFFNSPLRADANKLTENLYAPVGGSIANHPTAPMMPIQRNAFNTAQNLTGFFGGYGSGNNTERSNSLSWNDEQHINSNFSSAHGTPQDRQQTTSFFNKSLNISPPSIMDNQYGSQNQSIRTGLGNQSIVQSSNQSMNLGLRDKNTTPPAKEAKNNGSKSKKKTQESRESILYDIDVHKADANQRTTLMVKNIPNKYDLPLILEAIEKNHKGKFDFFYLPIDPRNKCNVGYAFINFIDAKYIRDFYIEFNGKKWEKFNSEKICEIKYGRIQGKKALVHHFQYSNVMNQQDKKLKPYMPSEYELLNNQKIKDLVTKQRMESAGGDGY